MKTYMQKQAEVKRTWHFVDAQGQILGKLATEIAQKLIGKNKPTYTPHIDGGDFVVVINSSLIEVSGNKLQQKKYYSHSGFPGNLKEISLERLLEKKPNKVIEKAVYNMLPKNKLRKDRMNRLKIYASSTHPHQSQLGQKKDN